MLSYASAALTDVRIAWASADCFTASGTSNERPRRNLLGKGSVCQVAVVRQGVLRYRRVISSFKPSGTFVC